MKDERALTLIELLVVVAIILILSSVTLLRANPIKANIQKASLEAQSREVLHTLLACRDHAIIDGYTRTVLIFEDKIYIRSAEDSLITKKIAFNDSISVTANTYDGKRLELKPIGTVNRGGHFTLEDESGNKQTIVIQIGSGRIYLKEGSFNSE